MLPQRLSFDLFEATMEVAINPTSKPTFKKWASLVQKSPIEALIRPAVLCINAQEDSIREKNRNYALKVSVHPLMIVLSTWAFELIPSGLQAIFNYHQVGENPDLGQGLDWIWKDSGVTLASVHKYQQEKHGYEEAWIQLESWVGQFRSLETTLQKEDLNFWTFFLARANRLASYMAYPRGLESKYPGKTGQEVLQNFQASIRQTYRCLFENHISFEGLHRLYSGELEGMKPTESHTKQAEDKDTFLFELRWMIEESRAFPDIQKALLEELSHPTLLRALEGNPNQETWIEMIAPLKLQATIPGAKTDSKPKARI